tara:strand:+ start:256 stop:453 length:198 start_codon:yes stop_codon:yes gene_type:complete
MSNELLKVVFNKKRRPDGNRDDRYLGGNSKVIQLKDLDTSGIIKTLGNVIKKGRKKLNRPKKDNE